VAYDPTAPIIQTDSSKRRDRSVVRTLDYDFGTFVVEDIPMDLVWPAGDPCPRDKETLVLIHERTSKWDSRQHEMTDGAENPPRLPDPE
jgi:hypothetical protein